MLKLNKKNEVEIINHLISLMGNFAETNEFIYGFLPFVKNGLRISRDSIIKNTPDFDSYTEKQKKEYYSRALAFIFFEEAGINVIDRMYEMYLKDSIKTLNAYDYYTNPFVRDVKVNEAIKENNLTLTVNKIYEGEVQILAEPIKSTNFLQKFSFVRLEDEVIIPSIKENEQELISLTPGKINTQQSHIDKLKGNTIILGLGLGFSAYMALLNSNVQSVTVVEEDEDLIKIFNTCILPQFKTEKNIKVINTSPLTFFLNANMMNTYDSCFIDLWNNEQKGYSKYIFFKENESNIKYKIEYYLERSMKNLLQEYLLHYLLSYFTNDSSLKPIIESYPLLLKKADKFFSQKNIKINTGSEIFLKCMNDTTINNIYKCKIE